MAHQHNIPPVAGLVELSQRRILINDAPQLVLAGEVHYFRLDPKEWEDRLLLLKKCGMDTVSTYIPWVWHGLSERAIDLKGFHHPQRNLVAFLDLCKKHSLNVIARPGPFCMAELKNEGLPYWLYDQPYEQPVTWDGAPVKTRARDYLNDDYLSAVVGWYREIAEVLHNYLKKRGGPVIAVQLDNEIGMLQWVSNCPDLSWDACYRFREFLLDRYSEEIACSRAGADIKDLDAFIAAVRSPKGDALALHQDLGEFMRLRFAKYVTFLHDCLHNHGVEGLPYLINVHGSGGGRGTSFPIGISQLLRTYENRANLTTGSDHYLGDLTVANIADLYLMNAFLLSTHSRDQPLTSLEFEVGNGNYGDDLGQLYEPESAELKARLCIAQGNKLLNYYLLCGGENPRMEWPGEKKDGIDRIGFTGQRHGFAAPVNPEGKLDATYEALGRLNQSLRSIEHLLADSHQEFDDIAIGFIPDHYMTEYCYPGSQGRRVQIDDLQRFRGQGPRDILARCLVLNGLSFPAINLQGSEKLSKRKALVVATGKTMSLEVQRRLRDFVADGGRLLLVGLLPQQDHSGAPCTVLAEALGLRSAGVVYDTSGPGGYYYPSVRGEDWAAGRAEVRVTTAQLLAPANGRALKSLLTEIQSHKPCAVQVTLSKGEAIFLGCDYPAHLDFYCALVSALNVVPRFQLESDRPGVVITPTIARGGRRLLHIINVAPEAIRFRLRHKGRLTLNGKYLTIPARTGWAIPFGSGKYSLPGCDDSKFIPNYDRPGVDAFASRRLVDVSIIESTLEIVEEQSDQLILRPTQRGDVLVLETNRKVTCRGAKKVVRTGKQVRISFLRRGSTNNQVFKIKFT